MEGEASGAPNKLLVTDLVASKNVTCIPAKYVRPPSDRLDLAGGSVPLIDVQGHRPRVPARRDFFQVKKHGVPVAVIDGMLRVSREYFRLLEVERMQCYSDEPTRTTRLSTSFNVRTERVRTWRDYLRLHCHPLDVLEAMSESLGMGREHIGEALGVHAYHMDMAINYYPPCPQPELTYGLPAHKDPNAVTVLLQDVGALGLHVLRGDGRWAAVASSRYTPVINIGDQVKVISNGRYKSALHRAVVNADAERISVASFYCPSPDATVAPADALVTNDRPPLCRSYKYAEYYDKFWAVGLNSTSCIDRFKA